MSDKPIRVKWIGKHSRSPSSGWITQMPQKNPQLKHCHFIYDLYEKEYDWLIVEDDMPKILKNKPYEINCPTEHTHSFTQQNHRILRFTALHLLHNSTGFSHPKMKMPSHTEIPYAKRLVIVGFTKKNTIK